MLGMKRTGKSALARALIAMAKKRGDKARVLDPGLNIEGGEWPGRGNIKKGEVGYRQGCQTSRRDLWLQKILDANSSAIKSRSRPPCQLIVFDDVERSIDLHPTEDSPFVELYSANAHYDVDVILTGRRPQSLPPALISGVDWLYLFAVSVADKTGLERASEVIHGGIIPTAPYHFLMVSPLEGKKFYGRTIIKNSLFNRAESFELAHTPFPGHLAPAT
jgi:hypothetical protein